MTEGREDFRFAHTLRVRWPEVDRQGIVFFGHYPMYCDVGVTEYWRAIGYPYPDGLIEHGSDLYIKKISAQYHASAVYDDIIDVRVRVARLGRSSLRFLAEVRRGDELLVDCELIYVNADPATRKSAPVPEFLRKAIIDFERRAPELA